MSAVAPLVVRTLENDIARGTASEVVSTPVVAKLIGSAVRRTPTSSPSLTTRLSAVIRCMGNRKTVG